MDMRQRIVRALALAAGLWAIAGAIPIEAREQVPFEQRQQMRQQMREHWQQMPPDQRDFRRQDSRERWQQMPSDERQRLREEMRGQRREQGGRGGRW